MNDQIVRDLTTTIDDLRLRPFLPLIYVAWSDDDFTADEVTGMCGILAAHSGIDIDCHVALRFWLDPDAPPSPQELETLRARVAAWAELLDLPDDVSAVDLGIALARSARSEPVITRAESSALDEIRSRYGPLGPVPGELGRPIRLSDISRREATFDIEEMTAVLDGRHRKTRQLLRRVLDRPEFEYADGLGRFDYREWVLERTKDLAAEGLGALSYPKPYGSDDVGAFVASFASLGHYDLSVLTKFGVQFGLFGGSIATLGTEKHHDAYLTAAGSVALPGCFAMTETGHGSNVRELETLAIYDGDSDEFVVNTPNDLARKDYIGNAAAHGQLAVVFARLIVEGADQGVHALVVPIRNRRGEILSGVTIEDNAGKGGLNGVDNGRIWFDRVRIPRTSLLDRFGSVGEDGTYHSDIPNPDRRFFTMIGTLVGGRVSVGAAATSVAKSALTIAIRYAHRRRQFGPSKGTESLLIDYPIHQRELLPRLAATYAYHFAFEELIDAYADPEAPRRRLETEAAGLKALATWHTLATVQAAREACGAQGYLAANRLTSMRADADIFTTYEGDNTVLLQLVAKALLTEFRQQFEAMSPTGAVRYILRRVSSFINEASPVTASTMNEGSLLDPEWQIDQLTWRESHVLESLALRLKNRIESGIDPTEAFSQVQNHAAAAAASHVDRLVLEAFTRAISQLDPGPERESLNMLRELHGLSVIQAELGWYQEHNRLSRATARRVRKSHDQLVGKAATESLALVDAFAIPDQVLGAPIAAYNDTKDAQT